MGIMTGIGISLISIGFAMSLYSIINEKSDKKGEFICGGLLFIVSGAAILFSM